MYTVIATKPSLLSLFLLFLTGIGVTGDSVNNQESNPWYTDAVSLIKENLKIEPNKETAKSSILFVGDGMGFSTITAARILGGQLKGETGEENVLSWEVFPWSALVKTYAVNLQGTDSASSATAFLSGIKTNEGILGVDESVKKGYCSSVTKDKEAISILTLAEMAGMSTGIVTTTRATHATPASAYAHSADRNWESDVDKKTAKDDASRCKDIALQLAEYNYGDGMEVVFAGGRRELMHENETDPEYPGKKGKRTDGKNLIKVWLDRHSNSQYVWNKTEFDRIDIKNVEHVIGLFEPSHMMYEVDRSGEPSIAEMVEKAIKILQKNPKGYFLFVEAGRIDHAHHDGNAFRALYDLLALDKAVAKALEIVNKDDTLIAVTADHSHVFTIGGYPKRGNPVFGLIKKVDDSYQVDVDNKTYTTLGYADGPGGLNGTRPDLRNVNTADKDFLQQATVLLDYESHGSEDIGVFAEGPGAYLFHGVVEQQYVFHVIDHALCLSESKQKSCDKHVSRGGEPRTKGKASNLVAPSRLLLLALVWLSSWAISLETKKI